MDSAINCARGMPGHLRAPHSFVILFWCRRTPRSLQEIEFDAETI